MHVCVTHPGPARSTNHTSPCGGGSFTGAQSAHCAMVPVLSIMKVAGLDSMPSLMQSGSLVLEP